MADLPLSDLTRPLTRAEARDFILSACANAGLPVTSWQDGGVAKTIVAIVAAVVAGFSVTFSTLVRGLFLDLAEGIWLTLLALYVYGVERLAAKQATGSVVLTNTAGGVFNNVQPGDLVLRNTTTGALYENTAEFSLGATPATATITVRAKVAGSSGTALTGAITEFVTPLTGVTATNPNPLIGLDEEKDPVLRQRCRDSLGAASPAGPAAAYIYFAQRVTRPDGSLIAVRRPKVVSTDVGLVRVYVAAPDGAVDSGDVDLIETELARLALPTGQVVQVESAVELEIAVVGTIYIDAAQPETDEEIEAAADAALLAYLEAAPIGGYQKTPGTGYIFRDALEGQVTRAVAGSIDVTFATPAADVLVDTDEVVLYDVGTWTITRVEQS